MARVKATKRFKDRLTSEYRNPGDVFTVTKERAEELAGLGVVAILLSKKPSEPPEDKMAEPEENK